MSGVTIQPSAPYERKEGTVRRKIAVCLLESLPRSESRMLAAEIVWNREVVWDCYPGFLVTA